MKKIKIEINATLSDDDISKVLEIFKTADIRSNVILETASIEIKSEDKDFKSSKTFEFEYKNNKLEKEKIIEL